MANTYLERIIEAGSVGRTFTYSVWFKRTKTGASTQLWNLSSDDDSTKYIEIAIKSDDKLDMQFRNGTSGDNGTYIRRIPTRVFRDTNAFFHIVLRFDSTESSADDRFRLYINGEQETSFSTSTGTIPQNYVTDVANSGGEHRIGRGSGGNGGGAYFEGSMSHFHFVDGQSYAPTVFGSTDSTTGEWKINPSPSISTANYGTNGFFILKDGNSVTDQSGNSHNFTVAGGTLTKTEDSPSNVFATYNPLIPNTGNLTFSNGNTTITDSVGSGSWTQTYGVSTLGMTSGKYYAETKVINIGTDQVYPLGLIKDIESTAITTSVGSQSNPGIAYYSDGRIISNGNDVQTGLHNLSGNGDIIGLAFDATNGTAQWYRNGATLGTQVTGLSTTGTWYFVSNGYQDNVLSANFGNGYFGTTAVSSAGTNASGNGIFEYDVPANFTALSTKGLNL